jgi:hypothetical protein
MNASMKGGKAQGRRRRRASAKSAAFDDFQTVPQNGMRWLL